MENINPSLPEIKKCSTKKISSEKVRFNLASFNNNNDIKFNNSTENINTSKSNIKSKKTHSCFFSPNHFNELKEKKMKIFKTLLIHKLNIQDKSNKYFQNSLKKIFEDSNHFLESKLDNNLILIGSGKNQYNIQYDNDSSDNSIQKNRWNKNNSFLSKLSGQNSSSGMNLSLYRASVSNIAIKNYIKKNSHLFNQNNYISEAQIDKIFKNIEDRIKKNKNKINSNININYSPEVMTDRKDLNHMLKIQEKIMKNKKIENHENEKIMKKLMKKTLKQKDNLLLEKQQFYRIRKEKLENREETGFNYFNKTNNWLLNLRSYNSNKNNNRNNNIIGDKLIKSNSVASLNNNLELKNYNFLIEDNNTNTINTSTFDKNSMISTNYNYNNSSTFRNLGHSDPIEFNNQYQLNAPLNKYNKKYDFGKLDITYRDLTNNNKICMNGNIIFASVIPSRNKFSEKIRSENTWNNFSKGKNNKNYNIIGNGGLNVIGEKLINFEKMMAKSIDGRKKLVKLKYRDEETSNKTFARSVSLINYYVPKSVKNAVDSHSL